MSEDVPFERADSGTYHVTQPINDTYPDEMTLAFGEKEYVFSGLAGVVSKSRVYPEVLAYENCEVTEVGDT